MDIKQPLHDLLTREMDRRDFLKHIGMAALTVVGVTGLVKTLTDMRGKDSHRSGGYGNSPYGR